MRVGVGKAHGQGALAVLQHVGVGVEVHEAVAVVGVPEERGRHCQYELLLTPVRDGFCFRNVELVAAVVALVGMAQVVRAPRLAHWAWVVQLIT